MILTLMILLNLLIALMSDSYERIQMTLCSVLSSLLLSLPSPFPLSFPSSLTSLSCLVLVWCDIAVSV
jgi:hypothetical protein